MHRRNFIKAGAAVTMLNSLGVGNAQDVPTHNYLCVRAGCWLRSDSIIIEEPIQIEELANRPLWLAVVMEDGYYRQYKVDPKYIPTL